MYPHNFLRRYRRAMGLTQPQVARVLGLKSSASVSRWESGKMIPGPGRLLELSVLYARLVNDLLRPDYLAARERIDARLRELHLR